MDTNKQIVLFHGIIPSISRNHVLIDTSYEVLPITRFPVIDGGVFLPPVATKEPYLYRCGVLSGKRKKDTVWSFLSFWDHSVGRGEYTFSNFFISGEERDDGILLEKSLESFPQIAQRLPVSLRKFQHEDHNALSTTHHCAGDGGSRIPGVE